MAIVRRDPNRCPDCGQRVMPFAAGCALCGATLDPARHDRRPAPPVRLVARLRARWRRRHAR